MTTGLNLLWSPLKTKVLSPLPRGGSRPRLPGHSFWAVCLLGQSRGTRHTWEQSHVLPRERACHSGFLGLMCYLCPTGAWLVLCYLLLHRIFFTIYQPPTPSRAPCSFPWNLRDSLSSAAHNHKAAWAHIHFCFCSCL